MVSPPAKSGGVALPRGQDDQQVVLTDEEKTLETLGRQIKQRADKMFGRSLHIREVDAGSCNGCEIEIVNLNSPVYDIERFGIHFVASPRHADMLLVTGPVTRNMELALRKTYDAMPAPRLVVAVGACGCSGGIFGVNYATRGAVDSVIPVDVYIPGCPPTPQALTAGLIKLQEKIDKQSIRKVRWYQKGSDSALIPIPVLGPDLMDPRRYAEIKQLAAHTIPAADQPAETVTETKE
jgi:NADH-quinone oxidoreductase B subunit